MHPPTSVTTMAHLSLPPLIEVYIYYSLSLLLCTMSNRVRVQQLPTGLINVSIPRALAQALRIGKGDVMEWVIEDGDLILKRVQE